MNPLLRDHLATIVAEELTAIPPAMLAPRGAAPVRVRRSWSWYAANSDQLAPLEVEQSERARATREIERVAAWFPWGMGVVARWLDGQRVTSIDELTDDSCLALRDRMVGLEEGVQHCCDSDEEPPAR
jgi:hypothetical protein